VAADRASGRLKAKAFLGLANLVVVMAVLVFVPAGTWQTPRSTDRLTAW